MDRVYHFGSSRSFPNLFVLGFYFILFYFLSFFSILFFSLMFKSSEFSISSLLFKFRSVTQLRTI